MQQDTMYEEYKISKIYT